MKLSSLRYYLGEAFKSLMRNRLMSLASIATVASCIFVLAFSYSMAANIDYILGQVEGAVQIAAFIEDDLDETGLQLLRLEIEGLENVAGIEFISHDEAFRIFLEDMADSPMVAIGLTPYDFPRSFNITLVDVARDDEVRVALQDIVDGGRGLEIVRYDQEVIGVISTVNNGIRIVSAVIIVALVAVSNVIIMNTIQITVNSRRSEINIMKYIGATDSFIRWPFIIEGMLIGLIGALIPIVLVWFGYGGALEAIYTNIALFEELITFRNPASVFVVLAPLSLTLGIGIGVYGSLIAMRKHLHV